MAVETFLNNERVLYTAPTTEQIDTFWYEIKQALSEPIRVGIYAKNETEHIIERKDTENRIQCKTAWNADMIRGSYADLLIMDEYQLCAEDLWGLVGAPMLLDQAGRAMFIYTPPSLHSRSVSKARDPLHAAKLFKKAQQDTTGRWEAFHFSSHDNPYISRDALTEIMQDMSTIAYRQEILAEDLEEAPGALWTRALIDHTRIPRCPSDLARVVVGVDPTGSQGNECGIVVAGLGTDGEGYVLEDCSLLGTPGQWADAVIAAAERNQADLIVGESNFGGDMVEATIQQAAKARGISTVRYRNVTASRGKAVRAEPVVAQYEHGRLHHIGAFPYLEDEMVMWVPGVSRESPNRIDALVWAVTELNIGSHAVINLGGLAEGFRQPQNKRRWWF